MKPDEPVTTEPTTTEPTGDPEVKMIPETRLNNLVTQINEKNAQIAKFEQAQAEIETAAKAKADEEALARGEHEKVIAAKDAELTEMLKKLETKDTEILKGQLERQLIDAGATDKFARDGMISSYLSAEERATEEDWLAALKEASPGSFETPATPVKTGNVGSVKSENGSLDARLTSTDAKVRMAALGEQLSNTLKGSL